MMRFSTSCCRTVSMGAIARVEAVIASVVAQSCLFTLITLLLASFDQLRLGFYDKTNNQDQ